MGLDKIFTITVDNASSNDEAISYLKKKLANWGVSVANSTYLHMRCMAHIINLVVMDGLKVVRESVMKVRDAVRYIRSSPARLKKFKQCVEYEKIEGKAFLYLDVPTRWNSYLMLNITQKYGRAFESNDIEMKSMGERMRVKFDKYWRGVDKMNKLIYFAIILDPHDKLEYMEYLFCQMYGKENGVELFQKKQKLEVLGGADSKTELEVCLSEAIQEDKEDFDILKWWKINSERFPILGKMARDILDVLVSTVASERALSTGGRVLDAFRSSLIPKIVEGLICA
ncbi:hypothetical protein GH714_042255 [Hevea brasiliensis]|uniref:HAT C-terminal dimerisation domain-containing protein n=1 Tax=Hevea brasiliensis TaxID=3981 RepID=A0A6A6MUQ4_HEVBR|nr:hypothetical protein GH714_042255 [Hevea brasiliensis]